VTGVRVVKFLCKMNMPTANNMSSESSSSGGGSSECPTDTLVEVEENNKEEISSDQQRNQSRYQRRHSSYLRTPQDSFNEQDEIELENNLQKNIEEDKSSVGVNVSSQSQKESPPINTYENPLCTALVNSPENADSSSHDGCCSCKSYHRQTSDDPTIARKSSNNEFCHSGPHCSKSSGTGRHCSVNIGHGNLFGHLGPGYSPSTPDLISNYNGNNFSAGRKLSSNSFSGYGDRRHSAYANNPTLYQSPEGGRVSSYHSGPSVNSCQPVTSAASVRSDRNEQAKFTTQKHYQRTHRESSTIGEIASSVVVSWTLIYGFLFTLSNDFHG